MYQSPLLVLSMKDLNFKQWAILQSFNFIDLKTILRINLILKHFIKGKVVQSNNHFIKKKKEKSLQITMHVNQFPIT